MIGSVQNPVGHVAIISSSFFLIQSGSSVMSTSMPAESTFSRSLSVFTTPVTTFLPVACGQIRGGQSSTII